MALAVRRAGALRRRPQPGRRDDLLVTDVRSTVVFGTAHPGSDETPCRVVGETGIGDAGVGVPGDANGDGIPDLVLPYDLTPSDARIVFGPIQPTGVLRAGHRVLCSRR